MLPTFEYRAPQTVEEVLELVAKYGEDARVLAGGHGLLPAMRQRTLRPKVLIDLRRVTGLRAIETFEEGGFRIGALATHHDIESSEVVQSHCSLLSEVAGQVGDVQVRNFSTLVGSICQAEPASDYPAALLSTEASVLVSRSRGERSIPVDGFLQGASQTALEPDEIVIAVDFPRDWPRSAAYVKVREEASGLAVIGVAAQVSLVEGEVSEISVGVTGAAERPFRLSLVEAQLAGRALTPECVAEAVRDATRGRELLSTRNASREYRAHLVEVCAKRALLLAGSRS